MNVPTRRGSDGFALLITLIALSLFSLLGLYVALNATTEVRISDNYESEVKARYAAQAGMSHARDILRGLRFDDQLKGPDGTNQTGSYLDLARLTAFRNPTAWATARSLDILNPGSAFAGVPDDGVFSTGKYGSTPGTVLIPLTGTAQTAPNPYGSGSITVSRYFVKVTDNNGEASELAKDGSDNPFYDGDGLIIVRSMGVAQTIFEGSAANRRRNSVTMFEARFKRRGTFDLDAPLVLQGNDIQPSATQMFNGNAFNIQGGSHVGIGTIDVNMGDAVFPVDKIRAQIAKNQENNITGAELKPSVSDITATVSGDPEKALLLNPAYLYHFANTLVPQFADSVYQGNQSWSGGSAPYLGAYDHSFPPNAPGQDPKVIYVDGDLSLSGNLSGGGLLVVTGKLALNGSFSYDGVILVIGVGELDFAGLNQGVTGGIYSVRVEDSGGTLTFGTPKFTMSGNSDIRHDSGTIAMAVGLIPPSQISFREISSTIDP